MKFLLDTNICILLFSSDHPKLVERVRSCTRGDLAISAVAFAEIIWRSARGRLPSMEVLNRFVAEVPILPFTDEAARHYATLEFRRRSFDNLIAAHALATGMTLVTHNARDFAGIAGLKIENWTA